MVYISKVYTKMEDSELAYWERRLGNRFAIGEQLGRTGATTSAYRIFEKSTNTASVLLIPNIETLEDRSVLQVYMQNQRIAEELKSFCIMGYTGNIFVPTAEFGDFWRIMPFAGQDFTPKIYFSLPQQEQEKLAFDFATYLNFVHQKSFECKKLLDTKFPLRKIGDKAHNFPIDINLKSYMEGKIPSKDYKQLLQLIHDFEKRNTSDEINVIIHGDLRSQNILYNPETKRLAIIDYELSASDNIYRDLCPCANSKLSPQFLHDVIRFYNEQPKKYPVFLNEEKVLLIRKVFYLNELVYCGMQRNRDPLETLEQFQQSETTQLHILSKHVCNIEQQAKDRVDLQHE